MKPFDSKNRDDFEEEHVSSADAMDEYFFDMLGSVADQQPLKKREEQEGLNYHNSIDREPMEFSGGFNSIPAPESKASSTLKSRAKFSEPELPKPRFAEPEQAKISPLIIPAAFPKLAPVSVEPEIKVKVESKTEEKAALVAKTEEKIAVSAKADTKTKIDRKTALEILEKKKSKLTAAQLERLEAKLGIKSKIQTQNETKVRVQNPVETVKKEILVPVAPEVKAKPLVEPKPESVTVTEKVDEVKGSAEPGEPGQAGPPAWAQDRFECLIFSVAGLKLAVPLVSLGAIYKIDSDLTPIVGRADYFMGLYRHSDRNVRVVDTAKWVMPDRWSEEAREGYHFIIRLGGNNWGLACDSVHESIQLDTDMVKWRSERTSRAWLSGTVIGHMCALLDADVLSAMLEEKATKHGSRFS